MVNGQSLASAHSFTCIQLYTEHLEKRHKLRIKRVEKQLKKSDWNN